MDKQKDLEKINREVIENFVKENELQEKYDKGEDFEWYFRIGMLFERMKKKEKTYVYAVDENDFLEVLGELDNKDCSNDAFTVEYLGDSKYLVVSNFCINNENVEEIKDEIFDVENFG